MADTGRLIDLATRIADRKAVNWDEFLSEGDEDRSARVARNLHHLQCLAQTLEGQGESSEAAALLARLDQTVDAWLATADPEPESGTAPAPERWGNLEIRALVGRGAFADVYRAHDPALQRDVALKLFRTLEPGQEQSLLAEGRRLAAIDHPHVVRIYGADTHGGRVGLWMEFIDGKPLDEGIDAAHPLGAQQAVAVGTAVCEALSAVHRAGLLHRDIKAQNVIWRKDGRVLLTDFGSGTTQLDAAATGRIRGTPLYLAPEVLAGQAASVAADIYGCGVLLFFLLSGRFPVIAGSLEALSKAHAAGQSVSLSQYRPDLDPGLVHTIDRALHPDPARRHGSASELALALRAFEAGRGAAGAHKRRSLLLAAAGVAAAMALTWQLLPPTSAPGKYHLDAQLLRVTGAQEERLAPGAAVSVGDRLMLSLSADRPLYVWVFNEDDAGRSFGLFPLAQTEPGNPLDGATRHVLPGSYNGRSMAWVVDSRGGVERIHIIASPEAVADIEALYRLLPAATLGNPALAPRGVGSLSGTAVSPVSATALLQAARSRSVEAEPRQGVWFHTIELAGDAP